MRKQKQVLRFAQDDNSNFLLRKFDEKRRTTYHPVNKCPIFSFFVRR